MPRLEVEGAGTFDVPEGKRLVLAIEEDAGLDILHRCGAYARCTTCRIEYLEGEPETMTEAERDVLEKRDLLGPGTSVVPGRLRPRHEGAGADDRNLDRARRSRQQARARDHAAPRVNGETLLRGRTHLKNLKVCAMGER